MYLGFDFSTRSGSSIGVDDFVIPEEKYEIVDKTRQRMRLRKLRTNFHLGWSLEVKDITR